MGVEAMHKYRGNVLVQLKNRARELMEKESDMREPMHADVREVLKNKNLTLFAELLQAIGFVDVDLVDDFKKGLRITGNAKVTGAFATEFKPAQLEQEDLWRGAKSAQAEVSANEGRPCRDWKLLSRYSIECVGVYTGRS